jgi:hypothetical protein
MSGGVLSHGASVLRRRLPTILGSKSGRRRCAAMQFLDAAFKAHLRLDEPHESQVIDASKWHNRI